MWDISWVIPSGNVASGEINGGFNGIIILETGDFPLPEGMFISNWDHDWDL